MKRYTDPSETYLIIDKEGPKPMSAKPEWTPGPWVVHPQLAWVVPTADPGFPICQMRMATDGESCEPQARIDAHLIAAAPSLYEALEWAIRQIPEENIETTAAWARWNECFDVMAKARGEAS